MRTTKLASALDPMQFEVHLAAGDIPSFLASVCQNFKLHSLRSAVSSKLFLESLERGTLPYSAKIVREQVAEDLELLEQVKPDLVVGDFRLSLQISARLFKVKYLNITNVTWHPDANIPRLAPDSPTTSLLGNPLADLVFKLIRPLVFRSLARPFKQIATEFDQPPPTSLMQLYTSGDYVFFADGENLVEIPPLSQNHFIAGPVLSSVNFSMPKTENSKTQFPSSVVVSLGSSGPPKVLPDIVDGLCELDAHVYVSTAGRPQTFQSRSNLTVLDYLPLDDLLKSASLTICNGGSPTGYASLQNGVPFIAVPSNLDQLNFSAMIAHHGAAKILRTGQIKSDLVRRTALEILNNKAYQEAALKIKNKLLNQDSSLYFTELVQAIFKGQGPNHVTISKQVTHKLKHGVIQ